METTNKMSIDVAKTVSNNDDFYQWLNKFEFSKPKRNLARDFSDGVLMAELLKFLFPRHVDLHNYPPANSYSNKLKNWITLNTKVLNKIGLVQPISILKEVANSNKAAVEELLLCVKNKINEIETMKRLGESDNQSTAITEDESRVVDIHIQSTVPYEDYQALVEQLSNREDEVQTLQAKIIHLESMLDLKEQRISDLIFQIKRCVCHKQ